MKTWKKLNSKYILKNSVLRVRRDECLMSNNRRTKNYYVIEKPDYAIIAAFTRASQGKTKDKKLIMIKQYRHPVGKISVEFPAGFIRKGEAIEAGAKRELLEETGYKVKNLKKIGEFYASPGVLNNKAHIFIGFNAEKTSKQKLDKHEQIEIMEINYKDALKLAKKGHIKDLGANLALKLLKSGI